MPSTRLRGAWLGVACAASIAAACSFEIVEAASDSVATSATGTGAECPLGGLGCMCTKGGGCDPGLECEAGVCIELAGTETGGCSALGCECNTDQDCDAGLECEAGSCTPTTCGDGVVDPSEQCDDANGFDGDGCDNDCSLTEIEKLALGGLHTCALIEGGRVRCWGSNSTGQIGLGELANLGDDEPANTALDLPLPAVTDIAAGAAHTCAVLESGDLRCWGFNTSGQLGLGNTAALLSLGDDEGIERAGPTDLTASIDEVGLGVVQTCARVAGQLRCWGGGTYGQLGLMSLATIGDDELPLSVEPVMLGAEPLALAIGGAHGCALVAGGALRCWGRGNSGQLGYANPANIGDDEHPVTAGMVSVIPAELPPETEIVDIGAGSEYTCALFSTGQVLCWGSAEFGETGQGNTNNWGDQAGEFPAALAPIELGGPVTQLAVGFQHACVLLDEGQVRCWGNATSGQVGYGNEDIVGDDETPADRGPVQLGAPAIGVWAGGAHSCALLEDQEIICWGSNEFGQLGYGHTIGIGDDEVPEVAGSYSIL